MCEEAAMPLGLDTGLESDILTAGAAPHVCDEDTSPYCTPSTCLSTEDDRALVHLSVYPSIYDIHDMCAGVCVVLLCV